jgi:hypothetical protein
MYKMVLDIYHIFKYLVYLQMFEQFFICLRCTTSEMVCKESKYPGAQAHAQLLPLSDCAPSELITHMDLRPVSTPSSQAIRLHGVSCGAVFSTPCTRPR